MGEGAAPWARRLLVATAVALAALFVFLAATRRLNFDESLALRAGRLECLRAGSEPPFVMPATLLFGALSFLARDPGTVFLLLRLLVAAAVLVALLALLRASALSPARRAFAVVFLLAMGAFSTHGLEFRYDAAILVGLMLAVAASARRTAGGMAGVGAALAFVALHQTKGLVLAALLLPVAAAFGFPRLARARLVRALGLGAVAVLAPWLLLLALLGLTRRWVATYLFFGHLGAGVPRTALTTALGPTMVRDLAWWSVATLALLTLLRAPAEATRSPFERATLVAILATLGFTLLHPHPWAYMVALPAPFLALVVAQRWPKAGDRRGQLRWLAVAGAGLVLQAAIGSGLPLDAHRRALAAPRAPEVRLLRELQTRAAPGDGVLDPTGLVYFLPPCTRQWYTDGLFVEAARRGAWMSELAAGVPASCVWALGTYRLASLPPAALADLRSEFRPVLGALAGRGNSAATSAPELPLEIENFW